MRDQRAEHLARILVRYSTRVAPGDMCAIQSTTVAEPLVQAVYEEVLRAGGLPRRPADDRGCGRRLL
jgi:aminopeptidase